MAQLRVRLLVSPYPVACLLALAGAFAVRAAPAPEPVPLALDGSAAATPWQRYGDWPDTDYSAFNTLAADASPKLPDTPVPAETPAPGDPEKGAALAFDRTRGGSCVACHVMGPGTPEVPGNVGPDLSQIGGGARPDDYLHRIIHDARQFNPNTMMPPWGTHGLFTPDEIGHLVAFLKTLTEPADFSNPLDDPARRPKPVEERDNLDPIENPGMGAVDDAVVIFERQGPAGKACVDCHSEPEQAFRTWAASMPRFEPRLDKVLGVEEFITRHARATTGEDLPMEQPDNVALAVYLRHLANGAPIAVDTESAGAQAAHARGTRLMQRKIGQLNFACVDCHTPQQGANKWIRGQWLGEFAGQLPHFPTWRTSRADIWDIRRRFQWCNVAIRANELPPDAREYGDIELALAAMNRGLPLNAPGIRH